jgi:hypothetical protein
MPWHHLVDVPAHFVDGVMQVDFNGAIHGLNDVVHGSFPFCRGFDY